MKKALSLISLCALCAIITVGCLPKAGDKANDRKSYKIGEKGPGGGIVFHVDKEKCLEVGPELGEYNWYDAIKKAKEYRGGGFTDWRLPDKDELNRIYQNLVKKGIIEGSGWYWSSSEDDANYTWFQRFLDGAQSYDYKGNTDRVRAVREFTP